MKKLAFIFVIASFATSSFAAAGGCRIVFKDFVGPEFREMFHAPKLELSSERIMAKGYDIIQEGEELRVGDYVESLDELHEFGDRKNGKSYSDVIYLQVVQRVVSIADGIKLEDVAAKSGSFKLKGGEVTTPSHFQKESKLADLRVSNLPKCKKLERM